MRNWDQYDQNSDAKFLRLAVPYFFLCMPPCFPPPLRQFGAMLAPTFLWLVFFCAA